MTGTITGTDRIDIDAYLDGELGPDEAAEIEARLEADPAARARFDADMRQREQVREALDMVAGAMPRSLQTARLERRLAAALARRIAPRPALRAGAWMRGAGQVAAACVLVAAGWWGNATLQPGAIGVPDYVSEAVGAHSVFAEDALRPAEFTGEAVSGAAEWFSAKVGVPVNVPDLADYGMAMVGARLLGTKEGALAQFIFEDRTGERYSLTLARHPDDSPIAPLHVVDYPDRTVGYWSTANLDFALVGRKDTVAVRALAADLSGRI